MMVLISTMLMMSNMKLKNINKTEIKKALCKTHRAFLTFIKKYVIIYIESKKGNKLRKELMVWQNIQLNSNRNLKYK